MRQNVARVDKIKPLHFSDWSLIRKKIEMFGSVWPECCVHTQSGWEVSQELVQIDALMSITESKH